MITIGGTEYEMAVNWNAIRDYSKRRGISDLSQLDRVLSFDVDGALTMAHCCIKEGERLAGRTLTMSEEELGAAMTPGDVLRFMRLYAEETTAHLPGGGTGDEKKTANL